jgi:protein TonB
VPILCSLPTERPSPTSGLCESRRLWLLVAASLLIHAGAALALLALPTHLVEPGAPSDWAVTLEFVPEPSAPSEIPATEQSPPPPAMPDPVPSESAIVAPPVAPSDPPLPAPEPAPAATPPSPPRQAPLPRRTDTRAPSADRRAPVRPTESGSVPAAVARLSPPAQELPITPPRPVAGRAGNRPPAYPERARQRGEEGRVVLRVDVSTDGLPIAVSVARSSGHPALDEAAVAAVRQWRFVAATRGGTAVPAAADVPVQFTLLE